MARIFAKSFVNSSEVIALPEEGKVLLSEIFRWYEADFGGKRGVVDFLYDYLADEVARRFIQKNAIFSIKSVLLKILLVLVWLEMKEHVPSTQD